MEPPYKREKAANYSMEENMVLYNLYKQNYHTYHAKIENGNRKEGARIRETLLYEWCRILSSLGVARREPSKVAEKIKKDFQTARYMINNYRQQLMNGPGGELQHPRSTHPHLIPLFDILEGVGVVTATEAVPLSSLEETKPITLEQRIPLPLAEQLHAPINHLPIPKVVEMPRVHQDIIMPRLILPSLRPTESSFTRPAMGIPIEDQTEIKIEKLRMPGDKEIARLKKRKIELQIDLIERQIQYQDALMRRDFGIGIQPSSSNSSADSLPATQPVAPTDFTSIFRSIQNSSIKQESFGFH